MLLKAKYFTCQCLRRLVARKNLIGLGTIWKLHAYIESRVTHMSSSKLGTVVYIWKRSVELFFSDEKNLTIADTTELIRYLLFWIIVYLAVKRIYSA